MAQWLERIKAQKKRLTEFEAEKKDKVKEDSIKSKGKFVKSKHESFFKSPLKATQRSYMNSTIASNGIKGCEIFNSSAS